MPYTKTQWKNGEAPAIDETNLNKIEGAIESATNAAESTASDLATLSREVAQNTSDIADLQSKATAVSVNPILTSGTKIAEITVDGDKKNLYAPSGGGGGGGASDWSELTGKPFEDISADDFSVDDDGVLHVVGGGGDVPQTVVIPATLQSGDTTCTITSSKIKSDSILQPMIWAEDGEEPKEFSVSKMVVRNGSCTLTFKAVSAVTNIGLAILGEAVEGGGGMEIKTTTISLTAAANGIVALPDNVQGLNIIEAIGNDVLCQLFKYTGNGKIYASLTAWNTSGARPPVTSGTYTITLKYVE